MGRGVGHDGPMTGRSHIRAHASRRPQRSRPSRLARLRPLPRRPRRRARDAVPRALRLALARARRRSLPRADVRDHRRVPPLLLAPDLPDLASLPARPRGGGRHGRAEGRALVGGSPPRPPPLVRRAGRRPLAGAPRVLVEPRGVDPVAAARRDEARSREGPRVLPGAAVPRSPPLPAPRRPRRRAVARGRLAGAALGLLRVHRRALARHLRHQLARPRPRAAALRDGRRLAPRRARASTGGSSICRSSSCGGSRRCGSCRSSGPRRRGSCARTSSAGGAIAPLREVRSRPIPPLAPG